MSITELKDIITKIEDKYKKRRMIILSNYEEQIETIHQIEEQDEYDELLKDIFKEIAIKESEFNIELLMPLILRPDKNTNFIKSYYLKIGGITEKIEEIIRKYQQNINEDITCFQNEFSEKEIKKVKCSPKDEPEHHVKKIITLFISKLGGYVFIHDITVYVHKIHDKLWSYQIRDKDGNIIVDIRRSSDSPQILASKPSNKIFDQIKNIVLMEYKKRNNNIGVLEENFLEIHDKIEELNPKPNFSIEPEPLFIKEDTKFKQFLERAHKVYLNPNVCFIAFKSKDNITRLLCVDNISQQVDEYQVKTLTHLNKQSNVRYVIETELLEEHLELIEQFQRFFLKTLKMHLLDNKRIFYETFKQIGDFQKSKWLVMI